MNCWYCGSKLIWNNDFSYEDYAIDDKDGIVTVLTCSNEKCNAYVQVYLDLDDKGEI